MKAQAANLIDKDNVQPGSLSWAWMSCLAPSEQRDNLANHYSYNLLLHGFISGETLALVAQTDGDEMHKM
jgi:hypothetical protein